MNDEGFHVTSKSIFALAYGSIKLLGTMIPLSSID